MNHLLPANLLRFVLLSLPLTVTLLAQEGPGQPATTETRPAPAATGGGAGGGVIRRSHSELTVSVKFRGGTMAKFVEALRDEQPKANVVLAELAAKTQVPAMELKGAGIEQALEAAAAAASADDEDIDVRVMEFKGEGEPVFSIVAKTRPRQMPAGFVPGAADRVLRVLSLNELIGAQVNGVDAVPVKTILSALELAVQDEDDAPRIRFHEDSGLLLVRGTHQQTAVLQEVLQTLQRDQQVRAQKAVVIEQERQQREHQQQLRDGFNGKQGGDGDHRNR